MDFDATLKRAFAEAPEAVDDRFVVSVSKAVSRREKAIQLMAWVQVIGMAVAAMAAASGLFVLLTPDAVRAMTATMNGFVDARTALSAINASGAAMTMLVEAAVTLGAVAGGVVLYRSNQQN